VRFADCTLDGDDNRLNESIRTIDRYQSLSNVVRSSPASRPADAARSSVVVRENKMKTKEEKEKKEKQVEEEDTREL